MQTLEEIISLLRIVIIPLGTIARVVFCFVKMIYDEDAMNSYKKKIWNTVAFLIIIYILFVAGIATMFSVLKDIDYNKIDSENILQAINSINANVSL